MCKHQGACIASCSHLDFHHKASLSSVCEKHSRNSRLSVNLHCNTTDCRSLWSCAFVSLLPAICMCGAPSLWCQFDTLYRLHSPSATHTHTRTHRKNERDRKKGEKETEREREQDILFILSRLWSYLFSEYVFQYVIPLWFLSIFHFGLSSTASQNLRKCLSLSLTLSSY